MKFWDKVFHRKDQEALYCFFLRAGDQFLLNAEQKSEFSQVILNSLGITNVKIFLFDATEWNSPVLKPQSPEQLKGTLFSMVTGSEVMNSIKEALNKVGVSISLDNLYQNSVIQTFSTYASLGLTSVKSSYARITYSTSHSEEELKRLIRQGKPYDMSIDREAY
jgi:hypothetical protein